MIDKLDIDEKASEVYNLNTIGIDGELIKEENNTYIMTSEDIFPVHSSASFQEFSGRFVISNNESDPDLHNTLVVTQEQFDIIKKLLHN